MLHIATTQVKFFLRAKESFHDMSCVSLVSDVPSAGWSSADILIYTNT